MTLTEGFDNIQLQPFLVDRKTGAVTLNFDPQPGMKGYFDFMVKFIFYNVSFKFLKFQLFENQIFRFQLLISTDLMTQQRFLFIYSEKISE
jgi:hypothetical protein